MLQPPPPLPPPPPPTAAGRGSGGGGGGGGGGGDGESTRLSALPARFQVVYVLYHAAPYMQLIQEELL